MAEDEVLLRIQADIKGVKEKFNEIGQEFEKTSKTLTSQGEQLAGRMGDIFKNVMMVFSSGLVINEVKKAIGAYVEQEKTLIQLKNIIELQGESWDKWGQIITSTASKMQSLTGFADDEMYRALLHLVSMGIKTKDAFANLGIILDLARGRIGDLGTASEYVGRAMMGQTEMLARYIPSIRQLTEEQRTWANIQKILIEQFSGLAEDYGKTLPGKLDILSRSIGDLKEALGQAFVPFLEITVPALQKSLGVLGNMFNNLNNYFIKGGEIGNAYYDDMLRIIKTINDLKDKVKFYESAMGKLFTGSFASSLIIKELNEQIRQQEKALELLKKQMISHNQLQEKEKKVTKEIKDIIEEKTYAVKKLTEAYVEQSLIQPTIPPIIPDWKVGDVEKLLGETGDKYNQFTQSLINTSQYASQRIIDYFWDVFTGMERGMSKTHQQWQEWLGELVKELAETLLKEMAIQLISNAISGVFGGSGGGGVASKGIQGGERLLQEQNAKNKMKVGGMSIWEI